MFGRKECDDKMWIEGVLFLLFWSTQQKLRVVPVTGPFVQTKALISHKEFAVGEYDFTAGADWIYKYKKYI
jgi:hypothetical protein